MKIVVCGRITPCQQGMACAASRGHAALDKDEKKAPLFVAAGMGYADAAAICGCRVGTIKSRVNRARESLRRNLD